MSKYKKIILIIKNYSHICYKPFENKGCMIQSVLEYFQNDISKLINTSNIINYIKYCVNHTTGIIIFLTRFNYQFFQI